MAPYAVRARPGAPVAAPIEWSELDNKKIDSKYFDMEKMLDRMKHKQDPWRTFYSEAQSLKRPRLLLKEMLKNQ